MGTVWKQTMNWVIVGVRVDYLGDDSRHHVYKCGLIVVKCQHWPP